MASAHEERRVGVFSVLLGFVGEPFVVADRSGIEVIPPLDAAVEQETREPLAGETKPPPDSSATRS